MPILFSGRRFFSKAQDRVSNAPKSLAKAVAVPGKFMNEIPVRQFALGRFFGRDSYDQTVNAMDKSLMPSVFFWRLFPAILTIPFLFHPIVAVKEGFDGIADLEI